MARNKPLGRKKRLARALKSNAPTPLWVIVKTLRKFRRRSVWRNWRRSRMQL
ncbi:MAG TPA: 50S ribosomal protein L39e [Thermoprotei archaeon]|nr:50S ribosomal protein L39e [Thermoprotei archaeon]